MKLQLTPDKRYFKVLSFDSTDEFEQLNASLTKKVENYRFIPAVKNGQWNGDVQFFDEKNNRFLSGLWKYVYDTFGKYNYVCKFAGLKELFDYTIDFEVFKEFCYKLMTGHEIQPRDYQIEAAYNILKFRRCSSLLSTSSGKTLVIFLVMAYGIEYDLIKNVIMVVPNVSLVIQAMNDFYDYNKLANIKIKIQPVYSGTEKSLGENITIGTYQSLVNFNPEFFKKFDTVIIDECLHKDTQITMGDNSKKFIKDIKECDIVKTINDITKEIENKKVDFVYKNLSKTQMYKIELENGNTLFITGNHRVKLVNGSYKRVDELVLTDNLLSYGL